MLRLLRRVVVNGHDLVDQRLPTLPCQHMHLPGLRIRTRRRARCHTQNVFDLATRYWRLQEAANGTSGRDGPVNRGNAIRRDLIGLAWAGGMRSC